MISEYSFKYPVVAMVLAISFCCDFNDTKFELLQKYQFGFIVDIIASWTFYSSKFMMGIPIYSTTIGTLALLTCFIFCKVSTRLNIFLNFTANLRKQLVSYVNIFNELTEPLISLNKYALLYLSYLLIMHPEPFNYAVYVFWVILCFGIPYFFKYLVNNIQY